MTATCPTCTTAHDITRERDDYGFIVVAEVGTCESVPTGWICDECGGLIPDRLVDAAIAADAEDAALAAAGV